MKVEKNNLTDLDFALSRQDVDFLTKQPIKFIEGNFADYMWGGYHLYDMKDLSYDKDSRIAAESWEISGHKKYPSRVIMPDGNIFTLKDLLENRRLACLILGEAVVEHFGQNFPILVKFVDVHKHMSAHLHPSHAQAKALGELDPGKEEVFIVLDLHENAESALYLGLKDGITREIFEDAIRKEENILNLSHKIYVQPGEIYRIPSGLLHCWTGGSIAVEITESSDLTYRLYDFRRQRPTHIKKGLASIDYNRNQGAALEKECRGLWQQTEVNGLEVVKTHNSLRVERLTAGLNIPKPIEIKSRGAFEALMGIEGSLEITSVDNRWSVNLSKGKSILIPSRAGSYQIKGLDRENNNCALRISIKIPGDNSNH